MDFIGLVYEFPASLPPPKNEDYFKLPVIVAEEMGMQACIYSMRTSVRTEKLEIIDGVKVYRFGDPLFLLLSALARKPLMVHGHSFGWVPSSVVPIFFRRYIFTPHIYRLDIFNADLTKLIAKLTSKSLAIIVLTKFEARWFKPYIDETKIHVIPHPVDFKFFSKTTRDERNEVREYYGIDGELILTVANLVPRKNLETLLYSFRLVNQIMPKSKLVIVGSEPPTILSVGRPNRPKTRYFEKLREMVSTLHLENKVIFTGYRNGNDLKKFYAAADVFALPSTVEGQLLSAGEAAASGLPLVLSKLEPLRETYDGCALFHAPFDHALLARHLIEILTNEKLARRLAHTGREKMRTYDVSVIKPKLKTLYENCLNAA